MRRGRGKAKGSQYEREICVRLSAWWMEDEDCDDAFWRSHSSGARATVRHRKGKKTIGQDSDVCATRKEAIALLKLMTIEIKRGHNKVVPSDIIDKPRSAKPSAFENHLRQAIESSEKAKTPFWMLIHKRDRRIEMVYIPMKLFDAIINHNNAEQPKTKIRMFAKVRGVGWVSFIGVHLQEFFDFAQPKVLQQILKESKHGR